MITATEAPVVPPGAQRAGPPQALLLVKSSTTSSVISGFSTNTQTIFSNRYCSMDTPFLLEPKNPILMAPEIILCPDKYLLSMSP